MKLRSVRDTSEKTDCILRRLIGLDIAVMPPMRDTPLSERRERERNGGKEEREYARLRNEDGERDKGWRKKEARGIGVGEATRRVQRTR